jgi:hypothetical protein
MAFNEGFYRIRAPDQSMLSHVAYVPRCDRNDVPCEDEPLAKMVADYLATTDWVRRYGLSYEDTMQLSYAEWRRMQTACSAAQSPVVPDPSEKRGA